MKRSVALAIVAIAAGGAVSLSAAGAAQASPHGGQTVSITSHNAGWDKKAGWGDDDWDKGHGKGHDGWGNGKGWGHGKGWNKSVKWTYAGSYHSNRICQKVARAGELTNRWDDSKCVSNGWGGAKLFVKKYRWGW
ncbi:hypothetical protein ACIA8K_35980 [Catenuloplanes sp. NPDC051500]|uniref:hypothetical protein n=1 Tax=Catenuloplanes sp. NPDC051500 TaxID=3363959 RepID=UPI0037BC07EA